MDRNLSVEIENKNVIIEVDDKNLIIDVEKKVFVTIEGGRGPQGEQGLIGSFKYLNLQFTHLAGSGNPIIITSENNQTGLVFTYSVLGGVLSISSPTLLSDYTPILTAWVNSNTIGSFQSFFDEDRITLFLRTFGGTLRYKLALILIPNT